jgi:hypothetical protein
MELTYGLGCPSCRFYVEVSQEDPDASLSELGNHIFSKHAGCDRDETNRLLAQAVELSESQAATR